MAEELLAQRVPSVDALRGLAALAVAFFHFTRGLETSGASGWFHGIGASGSLGVEVFFVLSGFAVPLSLVRRRHRLSDTGSFMMRRYERVGLPYLVAVALTWLLWWASATFYTAFHGSPAPEPTALWLGCHVSLGCDFVAVPWVNVVFWTLAIEFQYYLAIALLLPVLLRSRVVASLVVGALLLASLAAPTILVLAFAGLFVQGGLVLAWKGGAIRRSLLWAGLGAAALTTGMRLGVGAGLAGVLTALLVAHARLEGRVFAWLGGISYSLYLIHVPVGGKVMNLLARHANGGAMPVFAILPALALSIGLAWVFARVVEEPCLGLSRRPLA